jgi:hypothetical protein
MQRVLIIAVLTALLPCSAQAQSPSGPKELLVAPMAATAVAENAGQGGAAADICKELVAHLQEQQKAAGAGPSGGAANSGPSGGPSGAGAGPAPQVAGPGQSSPPVDRSQQSSGQSAPIPKDSATSTPAAVTIEQAQALAAAGDLRGCQNAVRQMRRAGVALPPGLIALAALREDLLATRR